MEKKRKVIPIKYLPTRFPTVMTAVEYLYLDKYNPAGWVWGVCITLTGIIWVALMISKMSEEDTDDIASLNK